MSLPKLIYFPSRGRAELLRVVLAAAGVAYDEENFHGADEFAKLKASGRLPFDAVPVWEEPDGFRLAQSMAIVMHVARGHGLYGKTPYEQALIDQALGAVDDVRLALRALVGADPAKRPELRAELTAKTLPRWTGYLERLLITNRGGNGFVVGEALSIADLAFWYIHEYAADNGFGAAWSDAPKLTAHSQRVAALPRIAAWLASPKRWPFQPLP